MIVMAASAGMTIFGLIVFAGICLLALGISDGGNGAIIGIGLIALGLVGIAITT